MVCLVLIIGINCTCRFLLIPLFNAERAWSYAMQLREVRVHLRKTRDIEVYMARRMRKTIKMNTETMAIRG